MTTKEQYWKHREKIRAYNKQWYKDNQEKQLIKRKEYIKNNKNNILEYGRLNAEKKKIIAWSGHRKSQLFNERGEKCELCSNKEDLQLHHLKYIKDLKFIQILCKKCHTTTHVKMRDRNL